MDDQIRRLERLAATGDYEARLKWRLAIIRAGYPDPDAPGPLTEWDEVQSHYDDLAWQRTTAGRIGWDWEPRPGCGKTHRMGGHRGWGEKNRKRMTLRTHRNSKHKSRSHKIKTPRDEETVEETVRARRRKKRFGGRETRRREWSYNPETERYRSWCVITKPNLNE